MPEAQKTKKSLITGDQTDLIYQGYIIIINSKVVSIYIYIYHTDGRKNNFALKILAFINQSQLIKLMIASD